MNPPLRFLHTADWHLGQPYRSLDPGLAARLRDARLEAVGRMLEESGRRGIDLMLVAGDQFDGPNPDPSLVRVLLDRIAAHPGVEVHLIPGNHDPSEPGSVYRRSLFEPPQNLHVHLRPVAVALPGRGATLFPCPCDRRSGDDPMAWIGPRRPGDGLRIALAHGSLPECVDPEGRTFPIAADAPDRFDLDYVALGDWHTARPAPEQQSSARMYYAGAPEVGGWDELGAGSALLVELPTEGPPTVRRLRTSSHVWTEIEAQLYAETDVSTLDSRLERLAGPDALVRIRASGNLAADGHAALHRLIERRSTEFAALILRVDGLALSADDPAAMPADPMLREALDRLQRIQGEGEDGTGERAVVVARAVELLRGLAPRSDG